MIPYARGLHELGDDCYAYLQPDGSWGWSNAGLVRGAGASLLVDTLFDLRLTAAMLEAMAEVRAGAPIATVVNTHANGDHCHGNQLVAGAEIVASEATAREMGEVSPAMLAGLSAAPGEVGELFRGFFGAFDFQGIELALPTRTFEGRLELDAGGRRVTLIEVGPAHTCMCQMRGSCTPATSCSSVGRRWCGRGRCRTGSRRAISCSAWTWRPWFQVTGR
jgi:cyclase